MSQYYNIKQYQPGGEWKSPYGMLDSFFLEIEGHENDTVMVNKKQGNTPRIGQVYGELVFKKVGKKGQNVYQFKQQEAPEGETAPATPATTSPAPTSGMPEWFAPYAVMIKSIYDAHNSAAPKLEEPFVEEKKDAGEDKVPGTNISMAELEDIFGGSMEPADIKE